MKVASKRKASSLVEVLIVLGIISTTLVVAVNLVISSLYRVKQNEIEDVSNKSLIKALEIVKAPSTVLVTQLPTTSGLTYSYSLEFDEDTNENFLKLQTEGIDSCEKSSDYYIDFDKIAVADIDQITSCLEIQVIPDVIPGSTATYGINAVLYYKSGDRNLFSFIRGIRYDEFTLKI
ncbi:MAG: hypothetical protein Q9M91_01285 [Candidatus Dojkabacteria bacterium]|nr:hypothetical protein [Candidatus Dojkabacteria bacterium]MDQ7020457.1 hypothetical protein [Candidatus Dojkabacteria bacterium]